MTPGPTTQAKRLCANARKTRKLLIRQISAVPGLCCIVTRRLVELVGKVFDPVVSSAIAVFVTAMPRVWFGCRSLSAWCSSLYLHDPA